MLIEPFHTKGTPGREAVVVAFDLEGFSQFFTQQDVQLHAPDFLNVVLDAFHAIFRPGRPYWIREGVEVENPIQNLPEPTFVKFMGDGGLYIWIAPNEDEPIDAQFQAYLMNFVWLFKRSFPRVVERARKVVPLVTLPERIRFGITRGAVYGLKRPGQLEPVDYIGFTINLAARLQSYCRELGFVASARVRIDPALAEQYDWQRVTATKLRGFQPEIVYVDKHEYEALDEKIKTSLFA